MSHATRSGDRPGISQVVRAIENQRGVVSHVSGNASASSPVADLEGALEHGGRSRVSIGSCQDSGAGTVLGESSRPANNAGKRVGTGCDRRQQAVVRDVIGEDAAIGQVDRQRGSIA